MMTWLISASLRQRVLVLAVACALVVFGIRAVRTTPLDVFPEFAPPLVEIQTEAPGLSTEEVESLISVPLENAVNGVALLGAGAPSRWERTSKRTAAIKRATTFGRRARTELAEKQEANGDS